MSLVPEIILSLLVLVHITPTPECCTFGHQSARSVWCPGTSICSSVHANIMDGPLVRASKTYNTCTFDDRSDVQVV